MPVQAPDVFGNYLAGKQARQQEGYANTRNALAEMDLQNAPQVMADQNALRGQQVQAGQMSIDAERAKEGYARLRQAMDSGSPRQYVLQREPELAAKLREHGVDLATVDDQTAMQVLDGFAREYAGKAGIAPVAKMQTIGDTANPAAGILQKDPTTGALHQVVAPQRPAPVDHFAEAEAGRNRRAAAGGGAAAQFATLTPEEVATEGLPKGTVAQRGPNGKINIIKKPDASGGGVKLTEGDKKARVMFASMKNAEKDLAKIKGVDTSSATQIALGSNPVTRGAQSDEFRQYKAAGLRWAANLLYLKSGATATPAEIESTWQQFFPQFGDGDGAKQEKAAARAQELAAIANVYSIDSDQQQAPAEQAGQPASFATEQEAEAAGIKPGTRVVIGGVPGTWQ